MGCFTHTFVHRAQTSVYSSRKPTSHLTVEMAVKVFYYYSFANISHVVSVDIGLSISFEK